MGLWSKEGASGLLADVKLFDLIHRNIKKMSKILSHKDVCHTLHDRFSPLLCFLNFYDFLHLIYVCFYVRLLEFSIDKQLQGNREIRDLRLHRYIPV